MFCGLADHSTFAHFKSEKTDWPLAVQGKTNDLPAPIILDPFMGSGTTALAAQQAGYRFFGCDLSPAYVAHTVPVSFWEARQALGGL